MKAAISISSSLPAADSQPMPPSGAEAGLIARCCDGDLTAFDCLVEQYQDRIFNLCYWMLGNRDEAADAAQDAFVRAFRSLGTFRGDSSFGTWLHRIAVNVAIDAKHRRKRTAVPYSDLVAPGEDGEVVDVDSIADGNSGGDHVSGFTSTSSTLGARETSSSESSQLAIAHERRDAVRHALARLPEHYRFVLVLFDIEGHSYDEISQSLKLPLGTVKSRINRARMQLRKELESARELFEE